MIGKAIYSILSNTSAVTDIVGAKIYPVVIPEKTEAPAVAWRVRATPEYSKSGNPYDECNVDVMCFARDYDDVVDLFLAVRAALENVRGVYNGVGIIGSRVTTYFEDYDREGDLFFYQITFLIKNK